MGSRVPSRSRTTRASSATSATPATASGTSPIPRRLPAPARCASRSSQRSEPTTISMYISGAPSGLTRTRALTSTSLAPRPQPEPLIAGSATVRPSGRHKAQELFPPSRSRPLSAAEYEAFWTTNLRTVAATITRRHIANLLARLATVQAQLNNTAPFRPERGCRTFVGVPWVIRGSSRLQWLVESVLIGESEICRASQRTPKA